MYRNIRNGAIALAVAMGGISVAASADASTPSASAQPGAVSIVGNAHGLKLQSQHTNSDGTVTSTWKDSEGQGFTYAGPAGAQFKLTPSATTVAGKSVHSLTVSVAQPAHGSPVAAVAAYARSGQSVLKDALNAGVSSAQAETKFGVGAKHAVANIATPNAASGKIIDSWCVSKVIWAGTAETGTGCVTEYLVQASPEYISDDMEGLASTAGVVPFTGFDIHSDYHSANALVVPPWIPNGAQGTDCHDVTASASFAGFGFSSTSTICGGSYVTDLAGGTFGMHWSGKSYGQVGLEPIDIVRVNNGDDYTWTEITVWH
jgi:hypothetical protein